MKHRIIYSVILLVCFIFVLLYSGAINSPFLEHKDTKGQQQIQIAEQKNTKEQQQIQIAEQKNTEEQQQIASNRI